MNDKAIARRTFLEGAALLGGAAALGLAGCSSQSGGAATANDAAGPSESAVSAPLEPATHRELTAEQQAVLDEARAAIEEWVEADRDKIVELCSHLIQAKSPSEVEDVSAPMAVVEQFCASERLPFRAINYDDKLLNMLSTTVLDGAGKHLMFNGHLDTMPAGEEPGWTVDPWGGEVKDGRIWGRGAADMKCGVGAELYAYKYLAMLKDKLPGKVSISLVGDEETGLGRGAAYMIEQAADDMTADCVLSAEPSGVESVNFSSKGYIQFSVSVETPGAIAGYANESESAILIAAQIITALEAIEDTEVTLPENMAALFADPEYLADQEYARGPDHAGLMTSVTVDACTIQGGSLCSVVAPDCFFEGAVVYPIGTSSDNLIAAMQAVVDEHPEATLSIDSVDEPDYSDPTDEMVAILSETITGQGYDAPIPVADIAISDCRYWRYEGVPCYWYGPYGEGIGGANEWVDIEELLHVTRVLAIAGAEYLILNGGN